MTGYATDVWPYVGAVALLLAGGVVAWVAACWWTGRLIHRPPRLTPPRALVRLGRGTPDDVGLAYEEGVVRVPDAARPGETIDLATWWLPAKIDAGLTCVLIHGYGDARPGVLPWASLLHEAGFHVLMLDLRAHGESGGDRTSGGVWERDDVDAVLNELRRERPGQTRRLVLLGVSFGGLIAAGVAARRDDLAGLVVDSPIASWRSGVEAWGRVYGVPLPGPRATAVRLWLSLPATARRAAVDLRESLAAVRAPTLLILPRRDVLLDAATAESLANLSSDLWRPDVAHNLAVVEAPAEYAARLKALRDHSASG